MRPLSLLPVVAAALLAVTSLADAAPGAGPPPVTRPGSMPEPRLAIKLLTFSTLNTTNKCGAPRRVDVAVANKALSAWSGKLRIRVGSVMNEVPVNVAADKTITVPLTSSVALDCKKALGANVVEALDGGGSVVFTRSVAPKTLSVLRSVASGSPPGSVFLRFVGISGTCGGTVAPAAHLTLLANQGPLPPPQTASVKLTFGAISSTLTASVAANQTATLTLPVPGTLDCQAPNGIPSVQYEFGGQTGAVDAEEVVFDD